MIRAARCTSAPTYPSDGDDRLPRVDAHPDADGPVRKASLGRARRGHGIGGARERDEERVALRVHLDAAVA